jgi:hypothetical protein
VLKAAAAGRDRRVEKGRRFHAPTITRAPSEIESWLRERQNLRPRQDWTVQWLAFGVIADGFPICGRIWQVPSAHGFFEAFSIPF